MTFYRNSLHCGETVSKGMTRMKKRCCTRDSPSWRPKYNTKINVIFRIFRDFFNLFFSRSTEKYINKNLGKIRTSRSKQNFTADRMEALSTSENHSKAQLLSKHVFFHDFCAKPVRRLGMGPLKKFKLRTHFGSKTSNFRRIVLQDEFLESPRFFLCDPGYVSS